MSELELTGNVFVITAPSGAGKTSLVNALVERVPQLGLSISHTTRQPRPGETNGVHYRFVDRDQFDRMVRAEEFVEHAEVFGNCYGTSVDAVQAVQKAGQDVILEIDWQGARQIKDKIPDAVTVFILPPSREALRQRLKGRAQDSDEVIQRRLDAARSEISHYAEFDYLVVNDTFERALDDLEAIMRSANLRGSAQNKRLMSLLGGLLDD